MKCTMHSELSKSSNEANLELTRLFTLVHRQVIRRDSRLVLDQSVKYVQILLPSTLTSIRLTPKLELTVSPQGGHKEIIMSIELNVTGMTCGHCKAAVEKALKSVSGVNTVEVNLEQGKARVSGDQINTDALIVAVVDEGYSASAA
jgi:copper chaperone